MPPAADARGTAAGGVRPPPHQSGVRLPRRATRRRRDRGLPGLVRARHHLRPHTRVRCPHRPAADGPVPVMRHLVPDRAAGCQRLLLSAGSLSLSGCGRRGRRGRATAWRRPSRRRRRRAWTVPGRARSRLGIALIRDPVAVPVSKRRRSAAAVPPTPLDATGVDGPSQALHDHRASSAHRPPRIRPELRRSCRCRSGRTNFRHRVNG
jgi:hypothetical protein